MTRVLAAAALVCLATGTAVGGSYVTSAACAPCHAEQHQRWIGSHHGRAMQVANEATVLGDFADRTVSIGAVTARFTRRDGGFWIDTTGPDGKPGQYRVQYTFGVEPLQQYLIELPGGRMQAFAMAWDTRDAKSGGQRWFHVSPEEADAPAGDPFHWSGMFFNWNSQCAACHSTALDKKFDAATGTYGTTWSDLTVGCESCHGPGAAHVEWAAVPAADRAPAPTYALAVDFGTTGAELQVCAPCHSRRTELAPLLAHGEPFTDHYLPEDLEEGLYHADGQILDEVYEYGSFVQSRMYARGVTCSDCHEPHGLQLRAVGDAMCVTCHNPGGNQRFPTLRKAAYAAESHHHHPAESEGARCVSCHMPATTYMVVDDRRDHGFRVPRPDLTTQTGAPNACNQCHTEKTPQWASDAVAAWTGRAPAPHWSQEIAAARGGRAAGALRKLVEDETLPPIVRATALELLSGRRGASQELIGRAGAAADPQLRAAAARALQTLPPRERLAIGTALLGDSRRAVRSEAAAAMAEATPLMPPETAALFARAAAEYRASQELYADRPDGPYNLATFLAAQGQLAEAKREYQRAIERGAYFIPAYVNLADLYRLEGDEAAAADTLRRAVAIDADNAAVRHALGLALVRQGKTSEGVVELERSVAAAPDNARYAYVYGVALHSVGRGDEAIRILTAASERHPEDIEILGALFSMHRERGETAIAQRLAEQLTRLQARNAAR